MLTCTRLLILITFAGEAVCAKEGTRLFTPTSKYDLDTVSKWLPSRRMQYSSDFEVFLGKILLNLI